MASHRNIDFTIAPRSNIDTIKDNAIIYSPNVNYNIGGGVSYKNFGVNGFIRIPGTNRDENEHGKTIYADFRAVFYKNKFGGGLFYKKYDGFYILKPGKIISDWDNNKPHPLRSDIILQNLSGEAYFVFNDSEFSMNAVCKQTERQKKDAHSFVMMCDASYLSLTGDSSMIPKSQENYYVDLKGFVKGDFLFSNLLVGYGYSKVINKNFYLTPLLFAGPGYVEKKYTVENNVIRTKDLMMRSNVKLYTAYNGLKVVAGFLFDANAYLMPEKEVKFSSTTLAITCFCGYRF